MVKRMLVDANHPEETRVVVLDGTRLEEFDLETSTKKQNKGNIYLAKVVRVEPSLQAAFVDYGGNRHGFLAFSEIHPDYYQIPVADREALLAEAKAHDAEFQEESDDQPDEDNTPDKQEAIVPPEKLESKGESSDQTSAPISPQQPASESDVNSDSGPVAGPTEASSEASASTPTDAPTETQENAQPSENERSADINAGDDESPKPDSLPAPAAALDVNVKTIVDTSDVKEVQNTDKSNDDTDDSSNSDVNGNANAKATFEEVGGEDETDETLDVQRRKFVASRRYKIQEVIKRRQILLIQVVKEERGNKGAALTTYLSLAGRYCVLMPNSSRGGGVSRKITNVKDRRRLKSILSDLNISEHMAVILRTAGAERSKAEVKRDFEYLQRTWNQIREVTMESRAPALIHEEANLIKRSIRDIYSKDIEEIFVEGEEGYKAAKEFMKTLTPSHAKKVKRYKDESIPLLHRYQVESQLDAMHSPTVQLRSGGSIVFGQTEALVAIDVNSGRATKERHIEETALKTNLEAADEIARQLRLRDLAGLVVIDFIDMDENRNNHAVERRLKEALKSDRARIQVGRISHFGLLELSRQRLRPSLIEANFEVCKSCGGTGMIRSTESTAVQTLRAIEEEGLRNRTRELTVYVHPDVALYILNYKRIGLEEIQQRYGMSVFILGDGNLIPPDLRMEKVKGEGTPRSIEQKPASESDASTSAVETSDEERPEGDSEGGRKRRRRRRRKRRDEPDQSNSQTDGNKDSSQSDASASDADDSSSKDDGQDSAPRTGGEDSEGQKKSRRRGRRGGRRRRRDENSSTEATSAGENADTTSQQQVGQINTTAAQETVSQTDPIPVQPDSSVTPKPPSRFLDVFRRGADALRPSSSATKPAAPEAQAAQAPVASESVSKPAPQLEQKPQPAPEAKSPETTPTPAVEEKPSGPPRKGWWNKDDADT